MGTRTLNDAIPVDARVVVTVLMVGFAGAANYTNHAPLVPTLIVQFHFSRALAGLLTAGLFASHAAMQIPGGYLADRFGARPILSFAVAILCIGNFAILFSTAYWQLLLWKVFIGIGTGTCFVGGVRYLASFFSGIRLQVVQGCYGGSILLGSGVAIFAVPRILAAIGWRGTFFATGLIATATFFLWVLTAPPSEVSVHRNSDFASMLRTSQLWLLGLLHMASLGLVIVVGTWITLLLRQAFKLPAQEAGLMGSMPQLLGIVSRPLGGVLAARVGVRPFLVASFVMTATGCFLLAAFESAAVSIIAILLLGCGCGLPFATLFKGAATLFPNHAGAAMGLVNMMGILMIVAGAPLVGYMADWSGNYRLSFTALGIFSLTAGTASLRITKT
jgi:nitrate/nitrite transporter NarK